MFQVKKTSACVSNNRGYVSIVIRESRISLFFYEWTIGKSIYNVSVQVAAFSHEK